MEWSRLTQDIAGRVSLEVHRRFLRRFVRPASRVLEIGAGPGRFTIELAALQCRIVVTDLSPVQLDLNAAQLAGTPADARVERRELLDVCDTTRYGDHEFDAVVAFGGPLSCAFERDEDALRGLLRILPPGGVLLDSSVINWASLDHEEALRPWKLTRTGGLVSSITRSRPAPNPAPATEGRISSSRRVPQTVYHQRSERDRRAGSALVTAGSTGFAARLVVDLLRNAGATGQRAPSGRARLRVAAARQTSVKH